MTQTYNLFKSPNVYIAIMKHLKLEITYFRILYFKNGKKKKKKKKKLHARYCRINENY